MPSEFEFIDSIERNDDLLEEVFKFDPRNLEQTSSETISKYTIALAQYIVYLNSQINKKKVSLVQKKRLIEIEINKSDIKTKTKVEKRAKVVESDEALQIIDKEVRRLEDELTLLDGSIGYFVELINAFKKELSRRDLEMQFNRYERRG